VAYKINGEITEQVPFDTAAVIEPVYKKFKGWNRDLSGIRKESELPKEFIEYLHFMEDFLKTPVKIISLGPDREATIER